MYRYVIFSSLGNHSYLNWTVIKNKTACRPETEFLKKFAENGWVSLAKGKKWVLQFNNWQNQGNLKHAFDWGDYVSVIRLDYKENSELPALLDFTSPSSGILEI